MSSDAGDPIHTCPYCGNEACCGDVVAEIDRLQRLLPYFMVEDQPGFGAQRFGFNWVVSDIEKVRLNRTVLIDRIVGEFRAGITDALSPNE